MSTSPLDTTGLSLNVEALGWLSGSSRGTVSFVVEEGWLPGEGTPLSGEAKGYNRSLSCKGDRCRCVSIPWPMRWKGSTPSKGGVSAGLDSLCSCLDGTLRTPTRRSGATRLPGGEVGEGELDGDRWSEEVSLVSGDCDGAGDTVEGEVDESSDSASCRLPAASMTLSPKR